MSFKHLSIHDSTLICDNNKQPSKMPTVSIKFHCSLLLVISTLYVFNLAVNKTWYCNTSSLNVYVPYVVNIIFRKELINLVLLCVFTHNIVYFYGLQYILYKGHPQLSWMLFSGVFSYMYICYISRDYSIYYIKVTHSLVECCFLVYLVTCTYVIFLGITIYII